MRGRTALMRLESTRVSSRPLEPGEREADRPDLEKFSLANVVWAGSVAAVGDMVLCAGLRVAAMPREGRGAAAEVSGDEKVGRRGRSATTAGERAAVLAAHSMHELALRRTVTARKDETNEAK